MAFIAGAYAGIKTINMYEVRDMDFIEQEDDCTTA